MNRLKYILKNRYLFKILALFIIFFSILYINFNTSKSIYNADENSFIGTVYKKKINNEKTTLYIKNKEKLIINYYKESLENINLGDIVLVKGTLKEPSNNTIPNLFNYKKYLYNNDIYYTVTATSINKMANNTNVIYYLKEKITKRINHISYANEYIKTFILGDTSALDEDIINSYRENGISHLFSVSGMHISLFASIILFFLKRISYNNYYNYTVVILFLSFYSLLIGSSLSVIRSLIMYILFSIKRIFNFKIKSIDIMCIVLIIMLMINPYYITNISFQYSYLISFSLVLFSYKIKNIKNKITKSLYTSLICFLISFPICIYHFYQINFLSIILNIFLIPYVSIIIFPLNLICFIIPKLSILLKLTTDILSNISLIISKYKI